jgi:hypothetical protein
MVETTMAAMTAMAATTMNDSYRGHPEQVSASPLCVYPSHLVGL